MKILAIRRDWVFWLVVIVFHFFAFATPEMIANLSNLARNLAPILGFDTDNESQNLLNFLLLSDKFQHFCVFLIMAVLCELELKFWLKITLLTLIGVETELIQGLLGFRDCSFWDLCADILGICSGFLLKFAFLRIKNGKKTNFV